MMLLEHDAKELLDGLGLPIPSGLLVRDLAGARRQQVPVVVKAQVPVGGRGKAGGIRLVRSAEERDAAVRDILGMTIKGHEVKSLRLEQPVDFVAEAYISFTLDASTAEVMILVSEQGGMDVEAAAMQGAVLSARSAVDIAAMRRAVDGLAGQLPREVSAALRSAGHALAQAFLDLDAMLVEINPLFIRVDGSWVVGDAKLVADDNAFERSDVVRARVESQPDLYPQLAIKLSQGYDYVTLDRDGDIGLVTTGAGLSMQLIDELVAREHHPFNFCDIRTGMFRGDPGRLVQVLRWIAAGPQIRVVLVNFFAGLTDLAEIAGLLLAAIRQVDDLKVPIVARLIGNNLDAALDIIAAAGNPILVETDLEKAIALASLICGKASA